MRFSCVLPSVACRRVADAEADARDQLVLAVFRDAGVVPPGGHVADLRGRREIGAPSATGGREPEDEHQQDQRTTHHAGILPDHARRDRGARGADSRAGTAPSVPPSARLAAARLVARSICPARNAARSAPLMRTRIVDDVVGIPRLQARDVLVARGHGQPLVGRERQRGAVFDHRLDERVLDLARVDGAGVLENGRTCSGSRADMPAAPETLRRSPSPSPARGRRPGGPTCASIRCIVCCRSRRAAGFSTEAASRLSAASSVPRPRSPCSSIAQRPDEAPAHRRHVDVEEDTVAVEPEPARTRRARDEEHVTARPARRPATSAAHALRTELHGLLEHAFHREHLESRLDLPCPVLIAAGRLLPERDVRLRRAPARPP